MCLWFAQMCEECKRITPIPWETPIECTNWCDRIGEDPNHLENEKDRKLLLEYTGMCCKHCKYWECGVYLRIVDCGSEYAISKRCKPDKESDDE